MRLRISIIFLALVAFPFLAVSQPADTSYKATVGKFFELIKAEKYTEAIDYIYSSNRWISSKGDEIASLKATFSSLPSVVGAFTGCENITEESIGSRYVTMEYAVYFERQPFRFYFRFYRPRDIWIIEAFGYKGDLDEWLQDKSKNRYLYLKPKP